MLARDDKHIPTAEASATTRDAVVREGSCGAACLCAGVNAGRPLGQAGLDLALDLALDLGHGLVRGFELGQQLQVQVQANIEEMTEEKAEAARDEATDLGLVVSGAGAVRGEMAWADAVARRREPRVLSVGGMGPGNEGLGVAGVGLIDGDDVAERRVVKPVRWADALSARKKR